MNFKVLTDTTQNLIFRSNIMSTEEPTVSNIHLIYMCGDLYPFIKPLPVRDKKSESFLSNDYKTPLVTREDKYVGDMTHDKPLTNLRRTVNLTNMGIHIHPIRKPLLDLILLVTYFFY